MALNTETTMQVVPAYGGGGGNGMFGDNGWWIILLFLFAWGRGGYGYGGGGDGGAQPNYTLVSDFAQVEGKLDGIANGICDSTYALNNAITGGFAAAQQTMTQGFAGLNTGMITQGYETRLGIQNVGAQLGSWCCDIKTAIAELKYANAVGVRDIIDAQNANYRALHDEITANRIEDKNDQIGMLRQQLFARDLAASQAEQNNYLIDRLGQKCPIPAYLTCNPFAPVAQNNCGCGS